MPTTPQHTEELAILFADISGSTTLYETLGNAVARLMVVRCLAMMTARLAAHRGTLIKTIGDEIMCTFPSAEAALRAACDMQDAVENGMPGGGTPIYVRIGFNYGEVLREANDVHGDVVNVAARITEVARARQILATHAAVEALPLDLRKKARHIRRASIKGRKAQLDLFQIEWISDERGFVRVGNPAHRKPEGLEWQLVLRYFEQQVTLSERNMSASLGSDEVCSIVVRDDFASDQHAVVEYQLGKFFISDRSSTGTYVQVSGGDTVHIVGEDTMLHGSGAILLGRPFSEYPAGIIQFSVHLAPISD
ncbi:MAG: adenylate/guanylate cyclase domain-containing protein [Burkholderiales bacterium]